ncbi:MAG: hypothetical protein IPL22_19780 [Bacteroidetes bacterium]|nr:hypothetical protein [Bacteroidota bacterium]
MSTTFPEFRNYLKENFFSCHFLNYFRIKSNAQTSFDLRIDGLVSGNPYRNKSSENETLCRWWIFMTGLNGSEDYFVIKTDSVGNGMEQSVVTGNQLHPAEIDCYQ